jgi:predicted transposase/invertase (TIGR01784 family)
LGQGDDYIYHGYTHFTGMNRHSKLQLSSQEAKVYNTNEIENVYPEYYIIKVNQFNDIAANTLDEWVYFLKNEEIKEEFSAQGLREAKERLNVLKLTDTEKAEYDNFINEWRNFNSLTVSNYVAGKLEGIEEGKQQGLELGLQQGILKEKEATVRKCLQMGMSINDIVNITGLSHQQVESLSK